MKTESLCQYLGTRLIVHLPAELDENSCLQVTKEMKMRMEQRQPGMVIFDFTNTVFMDSAGIGMLLARYKELSITGGSVYITGERDRIQRILRMSGIYTIMKHVDML